MQLTLWQWIFVIVLVFYPFLKGLEIVETELLCCLYGGSDDPEHRRNEMISCIVTVLTLLSLGGMWVCWKRGI